MTNEVKMEALEKELQDMCSGCTDCTICFFYDGTDNETPDEYACGIRDNNDRVPYHKGWNMKIALGIEISRKQVFPEEIEDSIMRHFTKGE